MPEYEKNCFSEFVNKTEDKLIFSNPNETKLGYLLNLMVTNKKESFLIFVYIFSQQKDNHSVNSFEELADLLKAEYLDVNVGDIT